MQNDTWTSEWPTEPGNYWFHGWLHKVSHNRKPETFFVKAFRFSGSNSLVFSESGELFCTVDGAKGLWLPAEVPEPSEFNVE